MKTLMRRQNKFTVESRRKNDSMETLRCESGTIEAYHYLHRAYFHVTYYFSFVHAQLYLCHVLIFM